MFLIIIFLLAFTSFLSVTAVWFAAPMSQIWWKESHLPLLLNWREKKPHTVSHLLHMSPCLSISVGIKPSQISFRCLMPLSRSNLQYIHCRLSAVTHHRIIYNSLQRPSRARGAIRIAFLQTTPQPRNNHHPVGLLSSPPMCAACVNTPCKFVDDILELLDKYREDWQWESMFHERINKVSAYPIFFHRPSLVFVTGCLSFKSFVNCFGFRNVVSINEGSST